MRDMHTERNKPSMPAPIVGASRGKGVRNGRYKALPLLLVFALAVGLIGSVPALRANAGSKVQPILLQMAAQYPDANLGVIVQKAVRDDSVEKSVQSLGGKVTKDLHIINAFAAELPARAVSQLAAEDSVRWVSLDAPVVKADGSCNSCIDTSHLQNAYDRAVGADRVW